MKKIIIIIVLVLLGAGGGVGYMMMSKGKEKEHKVEEVDAKHLKELTINIEEDTYTLAGVGQYAKLAVSMRAHDEESKEELDARIPEIKSSIVKELSGKTSFELRGKKGFEDLEALLEKNAKSKMKAGKIDEVNITTLQLQN